MTAQVFGFFTSVAGQDQRVSARELQKCLTKTRIAGSYHPFSLEACRLMILVLDMNNSGALEFEEFQQMWKLIETALKRFECADKDGSGCLDGRELLQVLTSLGYSLTPPLLSCIMRRYGENGRMTFDDFINTVIKLQLLTDHFSKYDVTRKGSATFLFDDFLQLTMGL